MKRQLRIFFPLALLAPIIIFSTDAIRAQASLEECQPIYQKFLQERTGAGIPEWTAAIATGRLYLQRCSALRDQDEVKNYVTNQIPKLENKISQKKIADIEAAFNAELKANNADGLIARAKELISLDRPYSLDLTLDIASVGFDKAVADPPLDKYNSDTIKYAKLALQRMSEGKASGNADKYGFYVEYKTKDCVDGKVNATGWMNYTIGLITFIRLKQTKEALPYIYSATQVGCETRNLSEAYRMIGSWYLDEAIKLNVTREEKVKAAGDKDTPETLAILALQKGYVDRAIDAYARAYKTASAPNSKASQPYKDGLLKKVNDLFNFRYEGDTSRVVAYLAEVMSKPFIDPALPISPVVQ